MKIIKTNIESRKLFELLSIAKRKLKDRKNKSVLFNEYFVEFVKLTDGEVVYIYKNERSVGDYELLGVVQI